MTVQNRINAYSGFIVCLIQAGVPVSQINTALWRSSGMRVTDFTDKCVPRGDRKIIKAALNG